MMGKWTRKVEKNRMDLRQFLQETEALFGPEMVEAIEKKCGGEIRSLTEATACRRQIQLTKGKEVAEKKLANTDYGARVISGDHFDLYPDLLEEVEREAEDGVDSVDGVRVRNVSVSTAR